MQSLIIGYGEIGRAVGINIGIHDFADRTIPPQQTYEVIHICYPCEDDVFVTSVKAYIELYKPEHVIVWSTVPIGTTRQIPGAVHSPIEGKHPDLSDSIGYMERWVGYNDRAEGQWFNNYFTDLGLKVKLIENSDFTEALKLLSTTEYGINIEFARYKKHIADEIGMDYELTKEWNIEYNRLYKSLGFEKKFQKFVLDAPEGPKGGHCVVPNARILHERYPSELTKIVGEL